MEVIVKIHSRARPDFARWLRSLPGPPADRGWLAAAHVDAMRELLAQTAGRVPGAVALPGVLPATYWCRFVGGWWMQYCVRTSGGFLRRRRTTVTILGLSLAPGGAAPQ